MCCKAAIAAMPAASAIIGGAWIGADPNGDGEEETVTPPQQTSAKVIANAGHRSRKNAGCGRRAGLPSESRHIAAPPDKDAGYRLGGDGL